MIRRFLFFSRLFLWAFWVAIRAEASEMRMATLKVDVIIRKGPQPAAEPLGRYPKGTRLRVFLPAREGWYATYFSGLVKGTHYGWLPAGALEFSEKGADSTSAAQPLANHRSWVGLAAGAGTFNLGVGSQPVAALRLETFLTPEWAAGFFLQYLSMGSSLAPSTTGLLLGGEFCRHFGHDFDGVFLGGRGGLGLMLVSGVLPADAATGMPATQLSGSQLEAVVGPMAGVDFGRGAFRYGIQADYLVFTGNSGLRVLDLALVFRVSL